MTVFSWPDQRNPALPRAVMQRGECERQQCGQYSISISNGSTGLTIRFETQAGFARFLDTGQTEEAEVTADPPQPSPRPNSSERHL